MGEHKEKHNKEQKIKIVLSRNKKCENGRQRKSAEPQLNRLLTWIKPSNVAMTKTSPNASEHHLTWLIASCSLNGDSETVAWPAQTVASSTQNTWTKQINNKTNRKVWSALVKTPGKHKSRVDLVTMSESEQWTVGCEVIGQERRRWLARNVLRCCDKTLCCHSFHALRTWEEKNEWRGKRRKKESEWARGEEERQKQKKD